MVPTGLTRIAYISSNLTSYKKWKDSNPGAIVLDIVNLGDLAVFHVPQESVKEYNERKVNNIV